MIWRMGVRRYFWSKLPSYWWDTFRQPFATAGQLLQLMGRPYV